MVYGTIVRVSDHRVRLTDTDLSLIVSALRARAAMCTGMRRHAVERLAERLGDLAPGNPTWRLAMARQTQEERLAEPR